MLTLSHEISVESQPTCEENFVSCLFQKLEEISHLSHFPCLNTTPHLLSASVALGLSGAPAISRPSRADPGDDRPVPKVQHGPGGGKLSVVGGEP